MVIYLEIYKYFNRKGVTDSLNIQIKANGTTSGWSNDNYKCFIDFYKAIDFPAFCRIQKKYAPKTAHNTFFLILYEMGLEDCDVRRIMGITQEAIRSTRYRIMQNVRK